MSRRSTPRTDAQDGAAAPPRRPGRAALLIGLVATALVAGAWALPLWQARLLAPQYPAGLSMHAYGTKVTGDVAEIDSLNHYVGMRAFDPADVPEMRLWPVALAVAVAAVVVAVGTRRRWPRRLGVVYLWLLPLGVLGMIQFRLHQYGTDLAPGAALRLDPFTPWVVGPTRVWNFTTWSFPGAGLACLVAAAAVVTFGPRVLGRLRHHRPAAAIMVGLLAVPLLLVGTPQARAADGHGGHGDAPAQHLGDLLARVPDGARIVLPAGTYRGPVVIDRPVRIDGRNLPTLVGDGRGTVLTIRAPGTEIRGIAVRGSGPGPTGNPAAIRVEADDVTIDGVVVDDSYVGIAVAGAERVRIVDSTIRGRASAGLVDDGHAAASDAAEDGHAHAPVAAGRGDGIWLHDAVGVLLRGNTIDDARDGIYVSFGSETLIDGNHVHDARYAVHSMFAEQLTLAENHFGDNLSGAVLMYGGDVLLLRNHIEASSSPSTGFGILLKDVAGVEVVENAVVANRIGLHLDGPAGADTAATFTANTVARNTVGVAAHSSARAVFRANSFADNLVQVMPQGGALDGLVWADRGFGNYWTSYRGYDANGAGRGAVPHVEGGAVDRVLLRNPELIAIARSPAMRLLRVVEERWGRRDHVLTDELPLTRPVSAVVPQEPAGDRRALTLLAGAALMAPAAVVWTPRRRATSKRSCPRVVPA